MVLHHKLKNQIPVISVIGIMGTTEESAVDPLEDIFEIREKLRKEVCFVTKLNCSHNIAIYGPASLYPGVQKYRG